MGMSVHAAADGII